MRSLQPRHKDESFAFLHSTTKVKHSYYLMPSQADDFLHSFSQKKKNHNV
jgi:hypothetical protein